MEKCGVLQFGGNNLCVCNGSRVAISQHLLSFLFSSVETRFVRVVLKAEEIWRNAS